MNCVGYLRTVKSGVTLDTIAAIASFFFLSFLFQIAANWLSSYNYYGHDFLWWMATSSTPSLHH